MSPCLPDVSLFVALLISFQQMNQKHRCIKHRCIVLLLCAVPLASAFMTPFHGLKLSGASNHLPVSRPRRCAPHVLDCNASTQTCLFFAAAAAAKTTFEAQPPPIGTSLAVLGSTGGVLAYWWLVVVPSERRDLAKNKNKGGLNDYLDSLENSNPSERKLEKWFYTEWLQRRARVKRIAGANAAKRAAAAKVAAIGSSPSTSSSASSSATAVFEGVTQDDLDQAEAQEAAEKGSSWSEASELAKLREQEVEKGIAMPRFLSLDNPIIIALSLALLGAAFGGLGR